MAFAKSTKYLTRSHLMPLLAHIQIASRPDHSWHQSPAPPPPLLSLGLFVSPGRLICTQSQKTTEQSVKALHQWQWRIKLAMVIPWRFPYFLKNHGYVAKSNEARTIFQLAARITRRPSKADSYNGDCGQQRPTYYLDIKGVYHVTCAGVGTFEQWHVLAWSPECVVLNLLVDGATAQEGRRPTMPVALSVNEGQVS